MKFRTANTFFFKWQVKIKSFSWVSFYSFVFYDVYISLTIARVAMTTLFGSFVKWAELKWNEMNWNEMMLFGAIPEWVEDRQKKVKCSFVAFCQFVQKNNSSYKNKNVLVNSISISLFHFRFIFCLSSTKFKWKSC